MPVSIPHWFSLNSTIYSKHQNHPLRFHPTLVLAQLTSLTGYRSINRFPSHIGSRSTKGRVVEVRQEYHVSIPHWFSLNVNYGIIHLHIYLFPSHIGSRSTMAVRYFFCWCLVSIPHWFSLNYRSPGGSRPPRLVSIPHWFSLNVYSRICVYKFN